MTGDARRGDIPTQVQVAGSNIYEMRVPQKSRMSTIHLAVTETAQHLGVVPTMLSPLHATHLKCRLRAQAQVLGYRNP